MKVPTIILAAAVALAATPAPANPLLKVATTADAAADFLVSLAHHKPKHNGGPPWARRGSDRDDRGERYWRERRYTNRDGGGEERRYQRDREYTRVCHTEYRRDFDPYTGDYVREPVRVCRERYSSGY